MSISGRSNRIREELVAATGGQFEVVREVGRGGMGWVFLARDLRLNRRVALKVLSPALLMEEGMGERFLREAQILGSLRHAHIVGVHAVHQVGDLHFFVMEFIDGPPLDVVLRSRNVLPVRVVRTVAYMVGNALDYGHHRGRGVIHRDIKPANVILDTDGSAVVTDFGISKVLAGNTRLTRTGLVIGTPEYMSPEQCGGDEVTGASDQYSMGALLYQMLTGHPPFRGTTVEVLLGHVQGVPEPIRAQRPDCPPRLAEAVERMLGKTPSERFAGMAQALEAMEAVPVGLRSEPREELAELARSSLSNTGSIDIASPLSPGRGIPYSPEGDTGSDTVSNLFVGSPSGRIRTGDSVPIWVDARDSGGHAVPHAPIRLSVDRPDLASLGDGGVLLARRSGTVTVTATTGEIERHFSLEIVEQPRPARIQIEPAEVDLEIGGSCALSAVVFDAAGEPIDEPVAWTLDDTAALLLADGVVRAVGAGAARVTASCGLASASVRIQVREPFAEESAPVAVGGGSSPGLRRQLAWAGVGLAAVALAWAVAPWNTTAPAELGGVDQGSGTPPSVQSSSDPGPFTVAPVGPLAVGDSTVLTSTLPPAFDSEANWSTSDSAVAIISTDGLLRAVNPGSATIALTAGGRAARLDVEVFLQEGVSASNAPESPASSGTASVPTALGPSAQSGRDVPPTEVPQAPPPSPLPTPGEVRIRVRPDAVTLVDGEPRPEEPRSTNILELAPGDYRIQLTRDGFVPFDTLVLIRSGQVVEIRTTLLPSGR
jgi:serine/threonine-protein kinase